MTYLERESSALYFNLSRFSFYRERLSWDNYMDRMLALKNMCEPSDLVYEKTNRILLVEEWSNEDDWPQENDDHDDTSSVSTKHESGEKGDIQPGISRDDKGDIHFLSNRKGLNDWVFHQYDVDFHPSIPHGHYKGKKHPKLDSYLGWVYQGSKQIRRLSRDRIIDLWNDEEFRTFARVAIEWYMDEFPAYNWRVEYPLMLPKLR